MRNRAWIFIALSVAGALTVAAYVYRAVNRTEQVATDSLGALDVGPHRIFLRHNGVDMHYGHLAHIGPGTARERQFLDALPCEVASIAAGKGICLSADRGVVTTYEARLFDVSTFETYARFPLSGIPSRTRMSSDGTLAGLTVFVSGHGYASVDFSTQTLLIDTRDGKILADLEQDITVLRDGKPFREQDFNYWGVTFTPDSRGFFATLSTSGRHLLVKGDVATRTATVIHENVECPSLSPDGTRVAYKKRSIVDKRVQWELHVLDLATLKETPLAEKRSVDDQLEWLDNEHVLYTLPEDPNQTTAGTDVWMMRSDGKGQPTLFIRNAYSPAVER